MLGIMMHPTCSSGKDKIPDAPMCALHIPCTTLAAPVAVTRRAINMRRGMETGQAIAAISKILCSSFGGSLGSGLADVRWPLRRVWFAGVLPTRWSGGEVTHHVKWAISHALAGDKNRTASVISCNQALAVTSATLVSRPLEGYRPKDSSNYEFDVGGWSTTYKAGSGQILREFDVSIKSYCVLNRSEACEYHFLDMIQPPPLRSARSWRNLCIHPEMTSGRNWARMIKIYMRYAAKKNGL
ncbi:hypothetical protein C8J57DRAFT_1665160 [Mycena rebaudengoi]|nr:hypothetical protein C8J57DRAFT_1665160 [Mycena rebaudengoi]